MSSFADQIKRAADDACSEISALNSAMRRIADERDQLKAELAKLQAERDEIDNGDGTVTAMLPVTYAKDLPAVAYRIPRGGERFVNAHGQVVTMAADSEFGPDAPRLILRHAPKPPEPVTWTAPLVDGEWTADESGFRDSETRRYYWELTGSIIVGLSKPAKLGRYKFRDGVGTLIQEAGNE